MSVVAGWVAENRVAPARSTFGSCRLLQLAVVLRILETCGQLFQGKLRPKILMGNLILKARISSKPFAGQTRHACEPRV